MNLSDLSRPARERPFGGPWPGAHHLDDEEAQLVLAVLAARSPSRFSAMCPLELCDRFERAFSAAVGVPHGVAVNSGSGALHVAMAALGVGPGQEVIVPGYLWISVVAAVVRCGAIPVLCEIDDSYALDPRDLERRITPRTTAIVHVHMSGATGNLDAVKVIAASRGLRLIEDCAQAAGGSYRGRMLGSFGHVSIFSFNVAKGMTTGEGGMVVTPDYVLYKRCQAAHDVGHSEDFDGRLPPTVLWGLGTVMTELQAAMGLVQLGKLPQIVGRMRAAKRRLRAALAGIPGIELRRLDDPDGDNGSFLITRYRDFPTAAAMAARLIALGLTCGPHGRLVHHFPDWGFHLYSNIPQLVHRLSNSPDGFPWTHPANRDNLPDYAPGSLPRTDDLFARSVLQAIPADATDRDTDDMIAIYRRAAAEVLR